MWNKIYLLALLTFVLLMIAVSAYSYSWLDSMDAPKNVFGFYEYYSNIGRMFLWISSIVLLVLGNIVYWKTKKSWAMWTSFLYFAVFILVQTFWLDNKFFHFKQDNNFTDSAFSLTPLVGILLLLVAGAIVFFNQFLIKRSHEKMFPELQPTETPPIEESASNDTVS